MTEEGDNLNITEYERMLFPKRVTEMTADDFRSLFATVKSLTDKHGPDRIKALNDELMGGDSMRAYADVLATAMNQASSGADPLWWFDQLTMDDCVALLANPGGALPVHLVEQFSRRPGWVSGMAYWVSNASGTSGFTLAGEPASALDDIREQLNDWWSRIESDHDYIIENRAGELDGGYADIVQSAGDPLNAPRAMGFVVVKDTKNNNRFRLPSMIRVYVEWKARERQSP